MGTARTVVHGVTNWVKTGWTERPLRLDVVFYLVCACYAVVMALADKHYGFRVWGAFAAVGYGLAFAHSCWLLLTPRLQERWWRSRWAGVAAVGVVGMLAPLGTLLVRRLPGGDWTPDPGSWSAQPEVWVIERSADLLLANGTPYTDIGALGRTPVVDDYTPYGPVMTVFGLPRALLTPPGGGAAEGVLAVLTDARLMFALCAVLSLWASLRIVRARMPGMAGTPGLARMGTVPVRAAQLVAVFPLTALTFATAGPDLAIVSLLVLATALAATDRPLAAAVVLALVTSAKLIAFPAAVVLAVLVLTRLGPRMLALFALVFVAGCAAVNLPVYLVDPAAFVEHVLRFPAGLGAVTSPAASPLPGHLIASAGLAGTVLAFVLLAAAAVSILGWLIRRPPTTGADALLRIAAGLGAFTLLTPATRFGYLLYPVVLLGAMLCLPGARPRHVTRAPRFPRRATVPPGTSERDSTTSS